MAIHCQVCFIYVATFGFCCFDRTGNATATAPRTGMCVSYAVRVQSSALYFLQLSVSCRNSYHKIYGKDVDEPWGPGVLPSRLAAAAPHAAWQCQWLGSGAHSSEEVGRSDEYDETLTQDCITRRL